MNPIVFREAAFGTLLIGGLFFLYLQNAKWADSSLIMLGYIALSIALLLSLGVVWWSFSHTYHVHRTRKRARQAVLQESKRRPPADPAELKRLHRELVKKYHPDFARNERERALCETLTRKINAAYQRQDIEALRTFE